MSLEQQMEALTQAIIDLRNTLEEYAQPLVSNEEFVSTLTPEQIISTALRQIGEGGDLVVQEATMREKNMTRLDLICGPSDYIPIEREDILDYDKDVKPITIRLSKNKGREAALNVLKGFNVKSAKELTPDQWPYYIHNCELALEGEDE